MRPTSRSAAGMISAGASTRPVNESTPPTRPISTPSGVTRPTRTPSSQQRGADANRMIAAPLRPAGERRPRRALLRAADRLQRGDREHPPRAHPGGEPGRQHDADDRHQEDRLAPAVGDVRQRAGRRRRSRAARPRADPTSAPSTAPTTPTSSPSRATAPRWARALEPISRSSAMVRVRPATIVAKVLAVTIAPT